MKIASVWRVGAVLAIGAVLCAGCDKKAGEPKAAAPAKPAGSSAAHSHDDHDHAHDHDHDHDHAPVRTPANLPELVKFVREHAANIEKEIASGKLVHAHEEAHAISDMAAGAGKLALADTTVAREKVRDINVAGKALADAADALHELADKHLLEDVKKGMPGLSALIDKLAAAAGVPVGWLCPMRCEPGKTYDQEGKCPVCRMALCRVGEEPYIAMVTPLGDGVVAPGKPVELRVELLAPGGRPIQELEVVHEHPLHLMTVSKDLSWYSHDHPERQPDGTFRHTIVFPAAGEFTFFADFTPKGDKQQVPTASIEVAGKWPERVPLKEDIDSVKVIDGYTVRMRCNAGPFMAGRDEIVRYGIGLTDDGTTVPDLEPIMGALGHLVIISEDLSTFVHSHPLNDEVKKPGDGQKSAHAGHAHAGHDHGVSAEQLMAKAAAIGNGSEHDPVFHVVFPKPGLYKSFAQFQHKGKVLTVPYTIDVRPGDPDAASPHHDHGKMGGGA